MPKPWEKVMRTSWTAPSGGLPNTTAFGRGRLLSCRRFRPSAGFSCRCACETTAVHQVLSGWAAEVADSRRIGASGSDFRQAGNLQTFGARVERGITF